MVAAPTHDDVNLILKLYDLRRESRMREARAWFDEHCSFRTLKELEDACPMGSDASQFFWQVVTYWDMVASFLKVGNLHRDLFLENHGEMVFVWLRIANVIPEMREKWKNPMLLENLEAAAAAYEEWASARAPEAWEAMKGFVAP